MVDAPCGVDFAHDLGTFHQRLADEVPYLTRSLVLLHTLDRHFQHRAGACGGDQLPRVPRLPAAFRIKGGAVQGDLPYLFLAATIRSFVGDQPYVRYNSRKLQLGRVVVEPLRDSSTCPHRVHYLASATAFSSASTSRLLPTISGVRSWISVGAISRMRCVPFIAAPPAASAIIASGLPSYCSRSLPFGALAVGGYRNMPPFS